MIEDTSHGESMTLALALNYGGRRDMVNAMRALAVRARAGIVIPEEINEETLREYLTTSTMPDPDLIVRTGGERRLSDFLLFRAPTPSCSSPRPSGPTSARRPSRTPSLRSAGASAAMAASPRRSPQSAAETHAGRPARKRAGAEETGI